MTFNRVERPRITSYAISCCKDIAEQGNSSTDVVLVARTQLQFLVEEAQDIFRGSSQYARDPGIAVLQAFEYRLENYRQSLAPELEEHCKHSSHSEFYC